MTTASTITTDSCKKGWADNFAMRPRFIFKEMRRILLFGLFGVETDLAETLGDTRVESERHVF